MQASWNSELDQQKQKQLSERSMKFEALQTTLHTTLDSQRCATLTTGSEKPTEPLFHEAEDCAMSHATTLTTVTMSCHLYTFVILWQSAVIIWWCHGKFGGSCQANRFAMDDRSLSESLGSTGPGQYEAHGTWHGAHVVDADPRWSQSL